ncbi:MAG TPA: hypothetical protein VGW37_02740 [Terriglobia bacterium]|nr:hypothetical protein [Terriglobia bacterium]
MRLLARIRRLVRDDQTHLVDLTEHFFRRLFDSEFISRDAEAHLGVMHILALLAVPAVFYTFYVSPVYGYVYWHFSWSLYDTVCISDQCRYVLFSMVVIGIVTVVEWDRLFPDGRDYAILMPLPLKLRNIFCAKIAALLIFVGLFILAVAGFPTVFYPVIEVGGTLHEGPLGHLVWLMAAHGIAVFSGCLFMFLFFVALQGALIVLLSHTQFRRVSPYVQGLATVLLVCQFFLLPLVPDLLPAWEHAHSPLLYALPPMWFLGLYRTLLGAESALFLALARISVIAFALSLVVAVGTYLACYRRHAQMAFEMAAEKRPSRFGIARLLTWLLDGLWLNNGPERGTFYFVLQTLARSAKHRLYFVGYVAVGVAFALLGVVEMMVRSTGGNLRASIAQPNQALLSIPLIVSFFTLVGMRAAFGFPAELPANWIFQITDKNNGRECLVGARKAMIALAVVPLFGLTLLSFTVLWGIVPSLLTVLFGVLLSLILTELLLYSFHKIPFTCSHLPGKLNLPLTGAIYWIVFAIYAYSMASLEQWMLQAPLAWVIALAIEAVVLNRVMARRNRALTTGQGVEYEDRPVPAVQTLDLNA